MLMRLSSLLSTTLRTVPTEPAPEGFHLLQRAGYLRPSQAGRYAWLPPGQVALDHLAQLLRTPLGEAYPLDLPPAQPASPGYGYGHYAGGLGAQAVDWSLLQLARSEISSYRQLPARVYQTRSLIQPGGAFPGYQRRWFEAWILAADADALAEEMDRLQDAYTALLSAWGLPGEGVEVMPALWGASAAWTWAWPDPAGSLRPSEGQDHRLHSLFFAQGAPVAPPVEPVTTPGVRTIAELAAFLSLRPADTAKVVCYTATCAGEAQPLVLMVVIRGDLEVNEAAVARLAGATSLAPASAEALAEVGAVPGYAAPVGLDHPRLRILADSSVTGAGGLVAGANALDTHLRHVQYGRDYQAHLVGNLHLLPEAASWPAAEPLGGLEWGGTALAEAAGATCMQASGRPEPLALGRVTWDLGKLLAALASTHQDAEGLAWPPSLAPFDLALISLADADAVIEQAEALYTDLQRAGWRVLYDDRPKKAAGPGVRFKDADLRGLPLRLTLGRRAQEAGGIEWKSRSGAAELIPLAELWERLAALR